MEIVSLSAASSMPLVIEPSWLGRRVSVRRVVSDTSESAGGTRYSDVVGDLLALSDTDATVETRHGRVRVLLAEVAIARVAPPSTADELALEAVAAQGWRPAETGTVGGWLLRAAGGFTSRANSVLPLRSPGVPLDEALERAGAWYAERGLPLLLQVPIEARRLLDAELGERGWPILTETHVLAAHLDVLGGAGPAADVRLDTEPDDAWLARYRDGDGLDPVARAVLVRHERVVFASVRDGGAVLAVGRGVVDQDWLGVSAVEVDPAQRRRGLARAVMAALWQWGREQGVRHSYLQVEADNEPALALYARLGYWPHHAYRYRAQPD
jgi:ribosomal protein S18 acetylase RimI-like enzyme